MKSDLDTLMQAKNLDAILVTGSAQNNPFMVYLTGGGHMTGDLIKKRNSPAVLFYNPMERDEAARTGLETRSLGDYNLNDLVKQADGDYATAYAARYQAMLADLGITSGRVAVYGRQDSGVAFAIFSALQKRLPEVEIVGETSDSLLYQALYTKDANEIERIRQMGKTTTAVVGQVADFLTSHAVQGEVLVKPDGQPLTIGEVKLKIDLWLAERGAANPEGTIFAIGADAGVPHSTGKAADLLRLGQTIVFDIYPCERGGGYFYDFTRTWCLGYAPDEVQAIYETVLSTYRTVVSALKPGAVFKEYQVMTCDLFEAQGHPTVLTDPRTQSGYVHGLGHGVGLHVHEKPSSGTLESNTDRLEPGVVFTIEPGLYYPERGLGVRLENTLHLRPDGKFEILAPYPLDLVLPVRKR